MKQIIKITLISLFSSVLVKAQFIGNYVENRISSGADGNYIFLMDDDYFLSHNGQMPTPFANGRKLLIERSLEGKPFTLIDTLRPVKGIEEFQKIWGPEATNLLLEDKRYFKFANEDALIDYFQNPNNQFYQLYLFPLKLFKTIGFAYHDSTASNGVEYTYRLSYSDTKKVLFEEKVKTGEPNGILQRYKFNFNQESIKSVDSLIVGTWVYLQNNLRMVDRVKIFGKKTFENEYKLIGETAPSYRTDTLLASAYHPAKRGEVWQVYVQPYDLIGNAGPPSDTATLISMSKANLPYVKNFKSKDTTNAVYLSWDKLPEHSFLSAYILSRTDANNHFEILDTIPLDQTFYFDYQVETGEAYNYEIQPLAAPVSNFRTRDFTPVRVSGSHKSKERVLPPQLIYVEQKSEEFVISWEPVTDERLSYYEVLTNSGAGGGDFRTIAIVPKSDTSYVDTLQNGDFQLLTRYYVIKSVSYGLQSSELSAPVAISPKVLRQVNAPNGLVIRRFENGIRLHWEQDFESQNWIKTYYIYKSKDEGEWVLMNPDSLLKETEFFDPEVSPGNYTYRISAVSVSDNESDFSLTEEVKVNPSYNAEGSLAKVVYRNIPPGIEISWLSVLNNRPDSIAIYRRNSDSLDDFKLLAVVPESDLRFWDKNVLTGVTYIYAVEVLKKDQKPAMKLTFTEPLMRLPSAQNQD